MTWRASSAKPCAAAGEAPSPTFAGMGTPHSPGVPLICAGGAGAPALMAALRAPGTPRLTAEDLLYCDPDTRDRDAKAREDYRYLKELDRVAVEAGAYTRPLFSST